MAKTYTLQGPIQLEGMTSTDALAFCAAVINAIPAYSMGTATLNLQATGDQAPRSNEVKGNTLDELKEALETATAKLLPKGDSSTIVYGVSGQVNLVSLSLEDGVGVIDAAMHNIPGDALVMAGMVAQETATAGAREQ